MHTQEEFIEKAVFLLPQELREDLMNAEMDDVSRARPFHSLASSLWCTIHTYAHVCDDPIVSSSALLSSVYASPCHTHSCTHTHHLHRTSLSGAPQWLGSYWWLLAQEMLEQWAVFGTGGAAVAPGCFFLWYKMIFLDTKDESDFLDTK